MREKKPFLILAFSTTTEAMAMEKYCQSREIPGRLIPLPKEISAGCGLAWKTRPELEDFFRQGLAEADFHIVEMRILELWG